MGDVVSIIRLDQSLSSGGGDAGTHCCGGALAAMLRLADSLATDCLPEWGGLIRSGASAGQDEPGRGSDGRR